MNNGVAATVSYNELQQLYAFMDQARQHKPALEKELADLQRQIAELEEAEIAAVVPEREE